MMMAGIETSDIPPAFEDVNRNENDENRFQAPDWQIRSPFMVGGRFSVPR